MSGWLTTVCLLALMGCGSALADFAIPRNKTPTPTLAPLVSKINRLIDQVKQGPSRTRPPLASLPLVGTGLVPTPSPSGTPTDGAMAGASPSPSPSASPSAAAGGLTGLAAAVGNLAGAGLGGKGAASGRAFQYNESAAKGQGSGAGSGTGSGGEGGGGGGGSGGSGVVPQESSGGGQKGAKPVAFPKWFPACVFMDNSVRNGNQVVKGLVDMAAACGVNLVVFPFYTKNMPGNAEGLKNAARSKCNAQDGFRQYGVNRAEAIVLTGNRSLPAQMCNAGNNPDANVCSEVGWNPGPEMEARLRFIGRYGGRPPAGSPAVSVIGPGGGGLFSVADVAAGQGQGLLNLPPGTAAGNGTGDNDEGYASSGTKPTQGWSDLGCQRMREVSFPNDGKWKYNADQKDYVVKTTDESRYLDLAGGKPIFRQPPGAPGAGGGGGSGDGGGGGGAGDGGGSGGNGSGGGAAGSRAVAAGGPAGGAFGYGGKGGVAAPTGIGIRGGRSQGPLYAGPSGDTGSDSSANSVTGNTAGEDGPPPPGPVTSNTAPVLVNNGSGLSQSTTYDESAGRTSALGEFPTGIGKPGSGTPSLSAASRFFSSGILVRGKLEDAGLNPLDGDFFRKLYSPPPDTPSWRRQQGAALRSQPQEQAIRDNNLSSVRSRTPIDTGNAGIAEADAGKGQRKANPSGSDDRPRRSARTVDAAESGSPEVAATDTRKGKRRAPPPDPDAD